MVKWEKFHSEILSQNSNLHKPIGLADPTRTSYTLHNCEKMLLTHFACYSLSFHRILFYGIQTGNIKIVGKHKCTSSDNSEHDVHQPTIAIVQL